MIENIVMIVAVLVLGIYFLIKLKKQFSTELFYQIGFLLFMIQGCANIWGLTIDWNLIFWWARISRIASIAFNFLIAYFFLWLKNGANAMMPTTGDSQAEGKFLSDKEVEEFMKK